MVQYIYTIGADLISQERGGRTYTYLYDGHGSVVGLMSEDGSVTDTYTYDAFGNLLKSTGRTQNNYRYCGEQFDSTTGLYYLRARYMDTSTGRFITQDSYAGSVYDPVSLHKYLYCNSDPVNNVDPSGYLLFGLAAGSVGSAAIDSRIELNYIGIYRSLVAAIRAVEPVITSIGALANNSILPIVAMVAVGAIVSITFTYAIKECIENKVSAIVDADGIKDAQTADNSVYILTEEDDPKNVRYVGRTCDVRKRRSAHANNNLKRTNGIPWHFYTIFTNLNIESARIYEQALISTYVADELKKNNAEKLGGNRINSINPEKFLDKDFLKDYDSAIKKFSELEFSFGESELLCLLEGNL